MAAFPSSYLLLRVAAARVNTWPPGPRRAPRSTFEEAVARRSWGQVALRVRRPRREGKIPAEPPCARAYGGGLTSRQARRMPSATAEGQRLGSVVCPFK